MPRPPRVPRENPGVQQRILARFGRQALGRVAHERPGRRNRRRDERQDKGAATREPPHSVRAIASKNATPLVGGDDGISVNHRANRLDSGNSSARNATTETYSRAAAARVS